MKFYDRLMYMGFVLVAIICLAFVFSGLIADYQERDYIHKLDLMLHKIKAEGAK